MDEFLFVPGSARALGWCRFLFYGWLLLTTFSYDPLFFTHLPGNIYEPISFYRLLPHGFPSDRALMALALVWRLSLLTSCLGFATRLSTILAAVLSLYLLGIPNNFVKISHPHTLTTIVAVILAASSCGRGFSLDALIRGKKAPDSGDFTWPLRLAWLAFALLMFAAGASKAAGTWVTLDPGGIQGLLQKCYLHAQYKGLDLLPLAPALAALPWLALAVAYLAMLLELAAPLALLEHRPRLRFFIVAGLFGVQLFNAKAIGIHTSFPWLATYAFWIPWDRLGTIRKKKSRVT